MNVLIIAVAAVIMIIVVLQVYQSPPGIRQCVTDSDCVPVGCECTCSGCGGFSYEDVVNAQHVHEWYAEHGCEPATICPDVCCPQRTVVCESGACAVKK